MKLWKPLPISNRLLPSYYRNFTITRIVEKQCLVFCSLNIRKKIRRTWKNGNLNVCKHWICRRGEEDWCKCRIRNWPGSLSGGPAPDQTWPNISQTICSPSMEINSKPRIRLKSMNDIGRSIRQWAHIKKRWIESLRISIFVQPINNTSEVSFV